MRTWLKVISGLLGAYIVLCLGLFAAMCQPPGVFGSIMSNVPMPLLMLFPFEPLWDARTERESRDWRAGPGLRLADP